MRCGWVGLLAIKTHRLENTADCSHLLCRQRTTSVMADKLSKSLLDRVKQELGLDGNADATGCVEELLESYTDLKTEILELKEQLTELKHKVELTELKHKIELGAKTQETAVLEGQLALQGKDMVIERLRWARENRMEGEDTADSHASKRRLVGEHHPCRPA